MALATAVFSTFERRKHFNDNFWGLNSNHQEQMLGAAPGDSSPSACEAEVVAMSSLPGRQIYRKKEITL